MPIELKIMITAFIVGGISLLVAKQERPGSTVDVACMWVSFSSFVVWVVSALVFVWRA